jgi:hypothetical protein
MKKIIVLMFVFGSCISASDGQMVLYYDQNFNANLSKKEFEESLKKQAYAAGLLLKKSTMQFDGPVKEGEDKQTMYLEDAINELLTIKMDLCQIKVRKSELSTMELSGLTLREIEPDEKELHKIKLHNPKLYNFLHFVDIYNDEYMTGLFDRENGIVDPTTKKVIYCRTQEQIQKQQGLKLKDYHLPYGRKVCEARSVWFFSEIASLGAACVGSMSARALKEHCSFKTLCLLSAAAVYPAVKEARHKLGVVLPSTKPSSILMPLPGGRTYEIKNPLEKALGLAGVTYFLSKGLSGTDGSDELSTNLAKAALIGASGYAGKKLVELAYARKISREE